QPDVAFAVPGEVLPFGELGIRDPLVPVVGADDVLDDFYPVEPMLDMAAVDDQPHLVVLADRARYVLARRIERVAGAGAGVGILAVLVAFVVQDLHLDAVFVRDFLARDLANAVEYAAVAALRDLPFELELEVLVLLH